MRYGTVVQESHEGSWDSSFHCALHACGAVVFGCVMVRLLSRSCGTCSWYTWCSWGQPHPRHSVGINPACAFGGGGGGEGFACSEHSCRRPGRHSLCPVWVVLPAGQEAQVLPLLLLPRGRKARRAVPVRSIRFSTSASTVWCG